MKLITRGLLVVATAACFASTAQTTQAGQWLDSIFGRRQPAYPVGAPVPVNGQIAAYSPGTYPSLGYVPPSYANLNGNQSLGYGNYASPPTNNSPLLAPGIPQTVAGYLPTAAYDTQWARTPVTYYRPVTAFDPRYGTTVTSLQPCTSYQYQAQRQPVIAPRPLLGEYGLQANRWPSITGPGYNPTGLANSARYAPVAQPYQNIPMGGMPMIGQPSNTALMGGGGIASGMPASTLPITTMPYTPAFGAYSPPNVPQPYLGQTSFYSGQNYSGQNYSGQNYNGQVVSNPVYSSSLPIGSGVVPTAAWMPSATACPNGMCPQPTNALNTPYVPGAASITPVGPPTYSATPNPSFGQSTNPNAGFVPAYVNPNANTNPYGTIPASGQGLQPNQVMPPITNPYTNPNTNPYSNPNIDPESMRRPSLGGSSASNNVQTLPMVAIDRGSNSLQNDQPNVTPNSAGLLKPRDTLAMGDVAPEPSPLTPNMINGMQDIPKTLTPRENYGMKPLNAPDDFDSKPRWTPTLLDPDDRTVMERSGRIRLREQSDSAVSAVALESTQSNRNTIQFVSGIETKKTEPTENSAIRFRAVTPLK